MAIALSEAKFVNQAASSGLGGYVDFGLGLKFCGNIGTRKRFDEKVTRSHEQRRMTIIIVTGARNWNRSLGSA